jgi:hypothetical protein
VVANDDTDVGQGQRKEGKAGRTTKFNLEASAPRNYNLVVELQIQTTINHKPDSTNPTRK